MTPLFAALLAFQPPAGPAPPAPQAPAQTQKVPGLEVVLERDKAAAPESAPSFQVDPAERFVNLRARPAPTAANVTPKLTRVAWVILSTGKVPPKINENLNEQNSVVTVGLPEAGESLYVAACALIDASGKPELTDHATTLVVASGAGGVGGAPARVAPGQADGPPAPIPATARGLIVVVAVADKRAPEAAELGRSAAVAAALAPSGSRFFLVDQADLARRPDLAPFAARAGLPCLIVFTADGRQALPAGAAQRLNLLRFDGRADAEAARRNEAIVLDLVGRAAGGR
jgi:hypothetical protein